MTTTLYAKGFFIMNMAKKSLMVIVISTFFSSAQFIQAVTVTVKNLIEQEVTIEQMISWNNYRICSIPSSLQDVSYTDFEKEIPIFIIIKQDANTTYTFQANLCSPNHSFIIQQKNSILFDGKPLDYKIKSQKH